MAGRCSPWVKVQEYTLGRSTQVDIIKVPLTRGTSLLLLETRMLPYNQTVAELERCGVDDGLIDEFKLKSNGEDSFYSFYAVDIPLAEVAAHSDALEHATRGSGLYACGRPYGKNSVWRMVSRKCETMCDSWSAFNRF